MEFILSVWWHCSFLASDLAYLRVCMVSECKCRWSERPSPAPTPSDILTSWLLNCGNSNYCNASFVIAICRPFPMGHHPWFCHYFLICKVVCSSAARRGGSAGIGSRPSRFNLVGGGEGYSVIHWIEGWMGLGIESLFVGRPARSVVTVRTKLYNLWNENSIIWRGHISYKLM